MTLPASAIKRAQAAIERLTKRAAKEANAAVMACAVTRLTDGRAALVWGMSNAAADDVLKVALSMLKQVEDASAQGATSCEGCMDRWSRARSAIHALQGGTAPKPERGHLH